MRLRLNDVRADIRDIHREYVRSEDFEDLVVRTLRQAADERSAEKRRIYGKFLAGLIVESAPATYDEQIEFLRVLDQLQADHLRLLRVLQQPPDPHTQHLPGRYSEVSGRLPDLSGERIDELITRLNDLHVTNVNSAGVILTGRSAGEAGSGMTKFGGRLARYLGDPSW